MNQFPAGAVTNVQYDANAKLPPLPPYFRAPPGIDQGLCQKVAAGLQLTRASTIALTRLQLALAGGDRRQAMAAIDRLHLLDTEIEHLVEGLPKPLEDDSVANAGEESGGDLLASLDSHLNDQKLALAFEKLALASGISGPGLVSANHPVAGDEGRIGAQAAQADSAVRNARDDREASPSISGPPHLDWHAFPDVQTVIWDRIPPKVWGICLAGLVAAGLVAAAAAATMV